MITLGPHAACWSGPEVATNIVVFAAGNITGVREFRRHRGLSAVARAQLTGGDPA
jgi:hypothetical protein